MTNACPAGKTRCVHLPEKRPDGQRKSVADACGASSALRNCGSEQPGGVCLVAADPTAGSTPRDGAEDAGGRGAADDRDGRRR
eukprot:3802113-Prymnesium_polylepis.1